MTDNNMTWYAPLLAKWLVAECGPKPTAENFKTAHAFKRPGVEALHIAMALRPNGCTVRQFQIAGSCGPANNTRRALVQSGVFAQTVTGKPYAYVLKLTAKGAAAAKANEAKAAPADKATGKAKPVTATKVVAPAKKPASKPRKPTAAPVAAVPSIEQVATSPAGWRSPETAPAVTVAESSAT